LIIKAKHNFLIHPFFKAYTLRKMKTAFNKIDIIGFFDDKKLPVLVVSNHFSWWDGFWLMYLNLKVLNRKFHFMMLEDQLRKNWFFKYTGGFSINKKSKSIIETLNYTTDLLHDSKNMVLIFPQGKITSQHEQNIIFENGVDRIVKSRVNQIQILFVVNLIDYFSAPKPSLSIFIKEYIAPENFTDSLELSYQKFYNESILEQKRRADL
jgi:1-acyl-sn-glycerol-3-phosphate acyltransferase